MHILKKFAPRQGKKLSRPGGSPNSQGIMGILGGALYFPFISFILFHFYFLSFSLSLFPSQVPRRWLSPLVWPSPREKGLPQFPSRKGKLANFLLEKVYILKWSILVVSVLFSVFYIFSFFFPFFPPPFFFPSPFFLFFIFSIFSFFSVLFFLFFFFF